MGEEYRERLVRGGQEHGDESACRDDAAVEEMGAGHAESALRNKTDEGAPQGPGFLGPLDPVQKGLPGPMFQVLYEEKGQKQDGEEDQAILIEYVPYQFQKRHRPSFQNMPAGRGRAR